uniref:Zinc finger protein Pegasus n=1 Tax=Petromyzon marinus TaxID=7757 RepID=S4R587_PETMA
VRAGEKPYRCHLCSFASAYVRHLEAHMRSHTGEKPYKCNLCSFRCSDRSNLSHHRRRRHKTSGLVGLSGHSGSLLSASSYNLHQHGGGGYGGRRASLSLNMSPPTMVGMGHGSIAPQSNARFHGDDLAPSMRNYSSLSDGGVAPEMSEETPLSQLSALAGQISCLVSGEDGLALQERDGKIMEHLYAAHNLEMPANGPVVAASISLAQEQSPAHSSPEPQSHHSAQHHHHQQQHHHSQPSSRQTSPYRGRLSPMRGPPALSNQADTEAHQCPHCDIYFPDNILYTIHMGCHGYENPFQCNVCGYCCHDRYDFSCHFARGQHKR